MQEVAILVCTKASLIIKKEEALRSLCPLRFDYRGRPKSCNDCPDHSYIGLKEVPHYIKMQYKTVR